MLKFFEKLIEGLGSIPLERNIIYIELDIVRFEDLNKEIEDIYELKSSATMQSVPDFGDSIILSYLDKTFIVSCNKKAKTQLEVINVAFKIKPIV